MKTKISTELHQGKILKTLIFAHGYSYSSFAEEIVKIRIRDNHKNPRMEKQSFDTFTKQKTIKAEMQGYVREIFGMTKEMTDAWFRGAMTFTDSLSIIEHYKEVALAYAEMVGEYKFLNKGLIEKTKAAQEKASHYERLYNELKAK